MSKTDDEIIEAMIRAILFNGCPIIGEENWRAALAAARPLIERETIERCAKVAGDAQLMSYGPHEHPERIAAAIRALAEPQKEPYKPKVTTGMSEGGA